MMRRRSFIRGGIVAAAAPSLLWDGLLLPAPARGDGVDQPGLPRPFRDGPIRLTQNENPLGMPPGVLRAVTEAATDGHRYPRLGQQLVRALAARNGLPPATVMLGNGSTEILRVAVHAAAARGPGRLVLPDPTYEAVGRFAVPWATD
ncbi:MAG TPA: hypothetical protein VK936_11030, partial [Longimicrobiales bacterium]|nr:hypothetical protein [Longimicrobiales bacterium]